MDVGSSFTTAASCSLASDAAAPPCPPVHTLRCRTRADEEEKLCEQYGQATDLWPRCLLRMCVSSEALRVKPWPHSWHWKAAWPVWTERWRTRSRFSMKPSPHSAHLQQQHHTEHDVDMVCSSLNGMVAQTWHTCDNSITQSMTRTSTWFAAHWTAQW